MVVHLFSSNQQQQIHGSVIYKNAAGDLLKGYVVSKNKERGLLFYRHIDDLQYIGEVTEFVSKAPGNGYQATHFDEIKNPI
jgi:hypothetical protein